MSEQPMGPGWWVASDGRWYPPEQHPDAVAAAQAQPTGMAPIVPPPAPPTGGRHLGRIAAIAAVVLLAAAGVGYAVANRGGSSKPAATDRSAATDATATTDASDSSSSSRSRSSESSSTSLAVDAPAGYKAYTDATTGFALALPDTYEAADLSGGDLAAVIARLKTSNPKLAAVLEKLGPGFQKNITLFAYDTESSSIFANNLNIVVVPAAADPTSSLFLDQVRKQLASIGATAVTTSTRTLPGGEAGVASYTIAVTAADGSPIQVHGQQGYVRAAGKMWILSASVAGSSEAFDTALDTFVAR